MSLPYRPLGIITEVIEAMGLDVTYAYDDLVFIEHNAFLLRMGEQGEQVYLFFNEESAPDSRGEVKKQLAEHASPKGLQILSRGTYVMKPREDDQIDIHFNENTS